MASSVAWLAAGARGLQAIDGDNFQRMGGHLYDELTGLPWDLPSTSICAAHLTYS